MSLQFTHQKIAPFKRKYSYALSVMLLARRILHNIMNVKQETSYYMFPSIDGDSSSFLATTAEA